MTFDRSKTLEELEGVVWEPPTFDSHLVTTCHWLRTKPLRDFSAGDLRIMILQKFSADFLVPLALEKLSVNPWIDGNYYEGDLLHAVLNLGDDFWNSHAEMHLRFVEILTDALRSSAPEFSEDVQAEIQIYLAAHRV